MHSRILTGSLLAALSTLAVAQPTPPAEGATSAGVMLQAVTVLGAGADSVAGSAQVIDAETLEASRVLTTNEALRKAGINVRDEEGFGLRPNIGIRGQNPTRSTKTLLLEDGLPLAYGPYGDNASYYHPPIERFDRIEVMKGAATTLYGPQTLAGVINYITPAPTEALSSALSLAAGQRDYVNAHGHVSGRNLRLDLSHKEGDGARDNTSSRLQDVNLKGRFELAPGQQLTLRANRYEEDSQVTYSGLTDAELRNFGPRYNPFKNDQFNAYRLGASATHEWQLAEQAQLQTSLYTARFSRDWWRQSSTTTDGQCGAAFTTARLNGEAVDVDSCNSAQGRLRDYTTSGIEPRLTLGHRLFGVEQQLQTGLRAHIETQDRVQENAASATGRSGTVVERNERNTEAYALFAQNELRYGAFRVTPGLRLENIHAERRNRLNGAEGKTELTEWIPSLAASYQLADGQSLFAGVHKGFAPPRTEDLIGNDGVAVDVDSESSVNAELGWRGRPLPGLRVEIVAFRNDFSRQIAVGSIAGGSTPLAVGETLFEGIELHGRADFRRLLALEAHNPFVELAYTWLPTAESQSAFRRVDNGQPVAGSADGRRLPYAPRHLLTGTLGYAFWGTVEARLEAVYIGAQFSDFANTEQAPANGNGQIGKLDSSLIWNAALNVAVPAYPVTLFVAAKNLGNEADIVDRTRGIQTNAPRSVQAGLSVEF